MLVIFSAVLLDPNPHPRTTDDAGHLTPVSIYGEFGVPVDFDLPMDTAVPTDFGVGGLGFGGAQTGFSTEGFGEPAGIGTDYCGDVMNGAGTDYLPPPSGTKSLRATALHVEG